jgi:hypothetical protein
MVGVEDVPAALDLRPCYQVMRGGTRCIVTFEGELITEIAMQASCPLRNPFEVSIGTVVRAFLAYHGREEWTRDLDRFLAPNWRDYCSLSDRMRSAALEKN